MRMNQWSKWTAVACMALPLLTACSSEEAGSVMETNPQALKVYVGINKAHETGQRQQPAKSASFASRATTDASTWNQAVPYHVDKDENPNMFALGETMGLFIRKAIDDSDYGQAMKTQLPAGTYDNVAYVAYGSGSAQYWAPIKGGTTVILDKDLNGVVSAYYPYKPNMKFDEARKYEVDCATNPEDLLVCTKNVTTEVNGSKPNTEIHMSHVLTLLNINIKKQVGFTGNGNMTEFRIIGSFSKTGTIDLYDVGKVVPVSKNGDTSGQDTIDVKNTDGSTLMTLSQNNNVTMYKYFIIPENDVANNMYFMAKIDGQDYNSQPTQVTLKPGVKYNIQIQVSNSGLTISGTDIIPWEEETVPIIPITN